MHQYSKNDHQKIRRVRMRWIRKRTIIPKSKRKELCNKYASTRAWQWVSLRKNSNNDLLTTMTFDLLRMMMIKIDISLQSFMLQFKRRVLSKINSHHETWLTISMIKYLRSSQGHSSTTLDSSSSQSSMSLNHQMSIFKSCNTIRRRRHILLILIIII